MKKLTSHFAFALLIALLSAGKAAGGSRLITQNASDPPQVLVGAENTTWTTTLDLRAQDDASLTFNESSLVLGPSPVINLPPGGEKIVRQWGQYVAGASDHGGFGLFPLSNPSVDVRVRLYYHNGAALSAFVVPKLPRFAQHAGDVGGARGVTHDILEGTQVVIFSKPQVFTLLIYDGSNNYVGSELIEPGEFAFGVLVSHRLQTYVKEGRLRIVEGNVGFGPNTDADAYGFIAVGPDSGTSQAVEVIAGTQ